MKFKADIAAPRLKSIISMLSALTDTAKLEVEPSGISAKAVDAAHVAMVSVRLPSDGFDTYEAEPCDIGLDLKRMTSVLKLAGPSDIISLSVGDDMRLTIRIGSITRRMALLDTADMSAIKIPSLSLSARVIMRSDDLMRGLRAVDGITDHLRLKASSDALVMSCEGDTDSMECRLSSDEVVIAASAEVRSMFPLDYMTDIAKTIPSGAYITLGLDTDYPMTISIKDGIEAEFMLAPRIESE